MIILNILTHVYISKVNKRYDKKLRLVSKPFENSYSRIKPQLNYFVRITICTYNVQNTKKYQQLINDLVGKKSKYSPLISFTTMLLNSLVALLVYSSGKFF